MDLFLRSLLFYIGYLRQNKLIKKSSTKDDSQYLKNLRKSSEPFYKTLDESVNKKIGITSKTLNKYY